MDDLIPEIKDPICGMTVDKATAIHAERDGKTIRKVIVVPNKLVNIVAG